MFKTWLAAARPKTLVLSVVPIVMGMLVAHREVSLHWPSFVFCLLMAFSVQVATNFTNDYCDFIKGADREGRLGPLRMMQAGLVTSQDMKKAIILTFAVTFLSALAMVDRGGYGMLLIAVLSIASGALYTAGPYPLAYLGIAEIFVIIFFGPVAMVGTYYMQTLTWDMPVLLMGFSPGFLSLGNLTINNLRDIKGDALCGKRTLAVRFGKTFARMEYTLSLVIPCLIPMILCGVYGYPKKVLLPSGTLLFALPVLKELWSEIEGADLNGIFIETTKLVVCYALLFCLAWVL